MHISEVLESKQIYNDDKARRRLNTAPNTQANITLAEINEGVTIERLESINVPVYQYSTQITIHGTFPELKHHDTDYSLKNVLGYKSLFLNGNGSLGVKYVAIDGKKKQLILDMSRYTKNKWHISISSEGLSAYRVFWTSRPKETNTDKQDCIDCYKSTPDDLYIGSKEAGAMLYGGYIVILHIGAIYETNLWKLIQWLTGIENQSEYESLEIADRERIKAENAKYDAERKAEAERTAIELADAKAKFVAPDNWMPFKGKITEVGMYARIHDTWSNGISLQVFKVAKRGAFLCETIEEFKDFQFVDWKPLIRYHKCERSIDGWLIQETVKTQPNKPKLQDSQSVSTNTSEITISHNEKLNGIEIAFKSKPSDTVLDMLRNNGFRWSYKSMLWYARYNQALMDKMNNELIGDKELCKV